MALFVLVGFLTAFFSKNMTVILLVAMILTNILRFGKDIRVKEGMEGGSETTTGSATVQIDGKEGGDNEGGDYQFLEGEDTTESGDKKAAKKATTAKPPIIESIVSGDATKSGSPVAATTASPAAAPIDESGVDSKLAGLDQETAELLKKQKNLMESMRNLEPMLSKAETFLDDLKKKI